MQHPSGWLTDNVFQTFVVEGASCVACPPARATEEINFFIGFKFIEVLRLITQRDVDATLDVAFAVFLGSTNVNQQNILRRILAKLLDLFHRTNSFVALFFGYTTVEVGWQ